MKKQYIEPQHTKEQFDKALALFNECGFEHITVDNEVDMVDCSWCPARSECTKFWMTMLLPCLKMKRKQPHI